MEVSNQSGEVMYASIYLINYRKNFFFSVAYLEYDFMIANLVVEFNCSAVKRRIIKWVIPLRKTFSAQALIFCFLQKTGTLYQPKVFQSWFLCAHMFCSSGFFMHFFRRTSYFRQLLGRVRFRFLFCLQKSVSLNAYFSQAQYYFQKIACIFLSSFSRTR